MLKSMGIFTNRKPPAAKMKSNLAALLAKADKGDANAQFSLGLHYSTANDDTLDFAQAAHWYRMAADQQHTLAQFNLGMLYERGQGMVEPDTVATDWIRKSAEGGDAGGQHHLGIRCHRDSLKPVDPDNAECRIEAYKWLQLAAAQEYGDSLTACQRLTLTMSQEEVDEGNRRVSAFVSRKASLSTQP